MLPRRRRQGEGGAASSSPAPPYSQPPYNPLSRLAQRCPNPIPQPRAEKKSRPRTPQPMLPKRLRQTAQHAATLNWGRGGAIFFRAGLKDWIGASLGKPRQRVLGLNQARQRVLPCRRRQGEGGAATRRGKLEPNPKPTRAPRRCINTHTASIVCSSAKHISYRCQEREIAVAAVADVWQTCGRRVADVGIYIADVAVK